MVHLQLLMAMEYAEMVAIGMEQITMMECGLIPAQTVGTIILQILMAPIALVQIVMTVE